MPKAKKLPSGSWRCQVFSHYEYIPQSDGSVKKKRIYESFTSTDPSSAGRKEAERMAAEFAYTKDRQQRCDLTVQEAIRGYIDSKTNVLSPASIRGYEGLYRNAYTDIGQLKGKKLPNAAIQVWVNGYSATHSPKSVRNAYGLLTAALSLYFPELRIHCKLPEKKNDDRYCPTDEDIRRLCEEIKGTELEKAVYLAAFGTMRRGEACAVTDKDIHGNVITVNKSMVRVDSKNYVIKSPKTPSSWRHIEYPDFVIRLFDGVEGRLVKLQPETVSEQFRYAVKRAGLPHFRFHDLRSYAVSFAHSIGIPDQYLMERGGWKTDRVLKSVYRRTMSDKSRQFTEQINAAITDVMQHEMQHKK